jgi:hypothetical protein
MDIVCSMDREKRNAYSILVGNPEGKRPIGRTRHRGMDDIVTCTVGTRQGNDGY